MLPIGWRKFPSGALAGRRTGRVHIVRRLERPPGHAVDHDGIGLQSGPRIDQQHARSLGREMLVAPGQQQPFHLDEEAAKGTMFGGLVASGWHTAAVTMRLLVESGLPIAGGLVGMGGEMSWPRPTRPGDVLSVVSEVGELTPSRSRPDRGVVRLRSETRNQRNEVVQILDAKLLVPRRVAKVPG
jgi:acyl dehydratase